MKLREIAGFSHEPYLSLSIIEPERMAAFLVQSGITQRTNERI